MILLDTNVASALRRRRAPEAQVGAWLAAQHGMPMFLSVVTVLEIERSILQLARRDARQGAALRDWLDAGLLPRFAGRILPIDASIARACAKLHPPDPRPELDAMIAATALVHDLTLATRNVRDFAGTGVRLVNPWDHPAAP